jgi:hypothetical protein
MKHFLAYGNSDQASFRDPRVRECFDVMTVPGTIAAYYTDATAAFVLSSRLDYVIDPRTPLFQGIIDTPRASHVSLAEHCGSRLGQLLAERQGPIEFSADIYSEVVIEELVSTMLAFQHGYGRRASAVTKQLVRYSKLLAEALGQTPKAEAAPGGHRPPAYALAPYFAMTRLDDPWGTINRRIWNLCARRPDSTTVSPVIAVTEVRALEEALAGVPEGLSRTAFFWVAGLNERHSSIEDLNHLWLVVSRGSQRSELVNLYGGFFSICLAYAGLFGFNNGLGYSESRDWPELAATGAAPARYYMPSLHVFVAPAVAQVFWDEDEGFRCSCDACVRLPGGRILALGYRDLKFHFAMARRRELEMVGRSPIGAIAEHLREEARRVAVVRRRLPRGFGPDVNHLLRWAAVLDAHTP